MSVTVGNIVDYLIGVKIRDYDYTNCTGEDASDTTHPIGEDSYNSSLINSSGDFMDAARKYQVSCATLWNNFRTALFGMNTSDLDDYTSLQSYFYDKWLVDYPLIDYPDASTFQETYNVIFQAITNCWLYELYSRVESEGVAIDKRKMCQKLLYDIVGRAAISPTISDPLDAEDSNKISSGASISQGDMSEDFLSGFADDFEDF